MEAVTNNWPKRKLFMDDIITCKEITTEQLELIAVWHKKLVIAKELAKKSRHNIEKVNNEI